MPIKLNNGTSAVRVMVDGTEATTVNLDGVLVHRRVTITFNANGGSFGGSSMITQLRTWGVENITTPSTPFRSGYVFLGWYTSTTGGSLVTFPRVTGQSNATYYARWRALVPVWNFLGAHSSSGAMRYDDMIAHDAGSEYEITTYVNSANSVVRPEKYQVGAILAVLSYYNDYFYFYERGTR